MNYIDLTCPAEIFRTAPPTKDISAATLTLFNLSDRVIASVEVLLRLLDAKGNESERLSFRGRALNGRPHSTFLLTVPCAAAEGLRSVEATIEKVWFADNDTWRRNPANAVEYIPNNLPVSPALTNLKYAAGETAVGYPSLQNGLWVCVCGRPNPDGADCCARCGQSMNTVFSRFTPEAVEAQISMKERQLDLSSRNMREDTIRLQRIREEEYQQKKVRRASRIRVLIAIPVVLGLTAGILFYISPALRLMAGKRDLENGDAASARKTLIALGSFGNANELIAESDWQLALQTAEAGGTAEDLAKASEMLRAIPDQPEAVAKADETDLARAQLLIAKGKWQEAQDALAHVPEENEQRKALIKASRLAEARTLKNNGDYAAAREIFLALGDYEDAKTLASECLYIPAREKMEQADWDGAIEMLSSILDYRESRKMAQECHFRKGQELEAAGEPEQASNEYLLAGTWPEAASNYRRLIVEMADNLRAAGDLKGAHALYASLPDYKEAVDKDIDVRYELAQKQAGIREYTMALEYLEDIGDDYKKTGSLRAEWTYQKAKSAYKLEDWSTAAQLLASIDREALRKEHRDVEDIYVKACRNAGIEPYPETPEPEAEPSLAPEAESTPAEDGSFLEPKTTASPNPYMVTEDDTP